MYFITVLYLYYLFSSYAFWCLKKAKKNSGARSNRAVEEFRFVRPFQGHFQTSG